MKSEEELKEYLECFTKDFFIKMEMDKPKLLIDMFESYVYQNANYADTKNLFDKLRNLEVEIKPLISIKGQELFEQYINTWEDFSYDLKKQAFIYGYCICKQLENETK